MSCEQYSSQLNSLHSAYCMCPICLQAIGGNIMTASPISDLNPVFMAATCKLTLMSKGAVSSAVFMSLANTCWWVIISMS